LLFFGIALILASKKKTDREKKKGNTRPSNLGLFGSSLGTLGQAILVFLGVLFKHVKKRGKRERKRRNKWCFVF
jgi:hypothetical protein